MGTKYKIKLLVVYADASKFCFKDIGSDVLIAGKSADYAAHKVWLMRLKRMICTKTKEYRWRAFS
jgi:hypothetical protein